MDYLDFINSLKIIGISKIYGTYHIASDEDLMYNTSKILFKIGDSIFEMEVKGIIEREQFNKKIFEKNTEVLNKTEFEKIKESMQKDGTIKTREKVRDTLLLIQLFSDKFEVKDGVLYCNQKIIDAEIINRVLNIDAVNIIDSELKKRIVKLSETKCREDEIDAR